MSWAVVVLITTPAPMMAATVLVAIALGAFAPAIHAAGRPTTAALDARLSDSLAADRIRGASTVAESLLATQRARFRGRPSAVASYLDTLGLRFLGTASLEGHEAARGFFARALEVRERAFGPSHPDVAVTLTTIGSLLDSEGRWSEALPLEERALGIRVARSGESDLAVADSRRRLGLYLLNLGRYVEAEAMLAGALALYESLPGDHTVPFMEALNIMGEVSRARDQFEAAAAHFERGLALAREHLPAEHSRAAALRNNLAGLYKDLGRYDAAEPLLIRFLEDVRRSPDPAPDVLATACLNLAEVYRLQDRLAEADPLYAEALAMARRVLPEGSPDLVPFINQAAVAAHTLGRIAIAESLYRETLKIASRALGDTHPLIAQSLHDLGRALIERGNLGEAEASLRRALAIRERVFGEAHPEPALTGVELARCLALGPPGGVVAAAPVLDRALEVLDAAQAYPEARLDAHALRARLRARDGRLDQAIADLSTALASVDTLRARRGGGDRVRGSFIARHLDLYHQMVVWRLESGDIAGALEAHERARARILLDQLVAGAVNLRAGIPADVLAPLERDERDSRERLARIQGQLAGTRVRGDLSEGARLEAVGSLEAARDSIAWDLMRAQESIKESSPLWRDVLNAGGRPAPLAMIQHDLLAWDEMMLVYHAGSTGAYLLAIPSAPGRPWFQALELDSAAARVLRTTAGPLTADKLERIIAGEADAPPFGSGAPLTSLLALPGEEERALPSQRAVGGAGLLERRLHALARVLMPPSAWRRVRGARQVVLVPDGALHLLPFEALVMRPGGGERGTRFWLDDGPPVRYATSATSLLSLTRRPAPKPAADVGPRVLSFSNPDYTSSESVGAAVATAPWPNGRVWSPLPGTARETEAIRRAFAPETVLVREGPSATEAALRAAIPGRAYLHLATHGFVTGRLNDLLGGLALAPGAPAAAGSDDDGLLQLFEIYELRLACELAVLSACGTQRGRRVAGEGVFALSRGFLAAGARRVIASLWAVSDESTSRLMGEFFAGVAPAARAGRTPDHATALRDARRRVRAVAKWSDPFYWAPFTLSGAR